MVHGIVDLTATGTTLRENGLVIREEISVSTARLIANPVVLPRQGGGDRRGPGAAACGEDAPRLAAEMRALVPPGASVADDVATIIAGGARAAATRRCEEYEARLRRRRCGATRTRRVGPP